MNTLPVLQVNLTKLKRNYDLLSQFAVERILAAVMKGNAYGLGLAKVAESLYDAGCRHFFIANWQEVLLLDADIRGKSKIYALCGAEPNEYHDVVDAGIIPVLHRVEQVEHWMKFSNHPFAIQINTSLNRLGLDQNQVIKFASNADLVISQLSCGYEPDTIENSADLALIQQFPNRSESSSCGFLLPNSSAMIRAGHWLYKIPNGKSTQSPVFNKLQTVATLYAFIITIRNVQAGDSVGYNHEFRVTKNMRIAILNIGYSSGYLVIPSTLQNVYLSGKIVPVVSQSMDFTTIDVTNVDCELGQRVELFGANIPQGGGAYKIRILGDVIREYLN